MTNETTRLRLSILGIIVTSLFAALLSRAWYLQVMDAETFQVEARANQVRIVYDPAPRGRVLDREGRVLIDNTFPFVVTLSRRAAQDTPEVVGRVATLLNMPVEEVERRLSDVRYSPYKPVPIAEDVPKEVALFVQEHQSEFPGVDSKRVPKRVYPYGSLAAHVLGYVGQTTADELKRLRRQGYREGDEIGRSGIEHAYEAFLRGEPGAVKLEVDATGRVLSSLGEADPVPGHDLQLTLDMEVQQLVEESLAQGLVAARRHSDRQTGKPFVAPAGAALVLDPTDGSILAMASNPTYEPAAFIGGIRRELFAELQQPESHYPLNNRAIQGQYPPGSTFKLVTALAALEKKVVDARTTIEDQGVFRLRNCQGDRCVFRNAGSIKHGRVDLARAMMVSSDVYFYALGATFWTNRSQVGDPIQDVAVMLGLGEKTGIPLLGEQAGRIWYPEDRRKAHEDRPAQFPYGDWRTGDNINLAIGQGDAAVTPLQLALAFGAFATGGVLQPPKIAARAYDLDGRATDLPGAEARRFELPPGSEAILAGLRLVVSDPRGTAHGAFAGFPAGYAIAGKTGTSEVHNKQDTALFVSFGPLPDPRYVVAVVMEEAGFGGAAAAPVARRIWQGLAGSPPGEVTMVGSTD